MGAQRKEGEGKRRGTEKMKDRKGERGNDRERYWGGRQRRKRK